MEKIYRRINFENKPSTKTPIGATNLNKMDKGIDDLDNRVVEQNAKLEALSQNVDEIANNQIPEEYLKASVDAYIDEKGAGLATDEDLTVLDTKIDEVNNKLSSEIANVDNKVDSLYTTEIGVNKIKTDEIDISDSGVRISFPIYLEASTTYTIYNGTSGLNGAYVAIKDSSDNVLYTVVNWGTLESANGGVFTTDNSLTNGWYTLWIQQVNTIAEENRLYWGCYKGEYSYSTRPNYTPYEEKKVVNECKKAEMVNTWYKGKKAFGMGDSLTQLGSGGYYRLFVKDVLELAEYYDCGIGGTPISGTVGENHFWRDERINAIPLDSDFGTIMGGTNDSPWVTVSDTEFTLDNCDVNSFVGAYNVLISKILYRFNLSDGYYSNIDYSAIERVGIFRNEFFLLLLTPPQRFDSVEKHEKSKQFGEYVKKIGAMWGIPVLDTSANMQMNYMTYPTREDKVHFPTHFHKKLADILIGKLKAIEPHIYITDYDNNQPMI